LLFPIFINDIVDEIQCNIRLFADDTSLYVVVEDAYEAAIRLIQRKYMNGQLGGWLILTYVFNGAQKGLPTQCHYINFVLSII
jgi:hypothetical protein